MRSYPKSSLVLFILGVLCIPAAFVHHRLWHQAVQPVGWAGLQGLGIFSAWALALMGLWTVSMALGLLASRAHRYVWFWTLPLTALAFFHSGVILFGWTAAGTQARLIEAVFLLPGVLALSLLSWRVTVWLRKGSVGSHVARF